MLRVLLMTAAGPRVYEARGVLAGAYKARRFDGSEPLLTHYYDVTDGHYSAPKSLCNRIKDENLCDLAEAEVTCKECVARFARRAAKGLATFRPGTG